MRSLLIWVGCSSASSVALGVGIYTAVVAPTSTGLTVSGTTASAPEPRPTVLRYKTKVVRTRPQEGRRRAGAGRVRHRPEGSRGPPGPGVTIRDPTTRDRRAPASGRPMTPADQTTPGPAAEDRTTRWFGGFLLRRRPSGGGDDYESSDDSQDYANESSERESDDSSHGDDHEESDHESDD